MESSPSPCKLDHGGLEPNAVAIYEEVMYRMLPLIHSSQKIMMFLMALPVLVVNHIPAAFRSFISCTISLITTEDPCPSEHRCASDFEPPLKAFRPEQVEISVPKKMCSQNNIYGCMFWLTQKVGASFHIFAVEESKVFPLCKSLCCKASSS